MRSENEARASQPFDRVNERFLAELAENNSPLGTRVVPRESAPTFPSLLPPKHPPLSRSLPARHSAPLTVSLPVSLTLVRAGARETEPPLRLRSIAGTKASVNPPPPPFRRESHVEITLSKQDARRLDRPRLRFDGDVLTWSFASTSSARACYPVAG